MNWMRRLMAGRYGMDQLNLALMLLYLVLYLLGSLLHLGVVAFLAFLCLAAVLLRMFSRRMDKRRAENERFLNAVGPAIRKINVYRCRMKDKDHAYFRCPGCGQQLRAPKGKGKISVTCRSCGATFEKKT